MTIYWQWGEILNNGFQNEHQEGRYRDWETVSICDCDW